jgi:Zn-dependent protease with chaperone function
MKQEKFEALVRKLEKVAVQNPQGYKTKVAALAVMGYGFIFFMLALLLALLIGIGIFVVNHKGLSYAGGKLFFFLLIVVYAVVRSLWVKIEPPDGLPLTRGQTPELFNLIDDVAKRLNSPPPDVVLLTDDFNCAVAQVPRLGIFGFYRSYLILGLPMLHALSPDEFKAVLAHEFGHLSGNHGRFSGWIYRVRATWYRLLESLEGNHGQGLFRWFSIGMRPILARIRLCWPAPMNTSPTAVPSKLRGAAPAPTLCFAPLWRRRISMKNSGRAFFGRPTRGPRRPCHSPI